jgi:hypothetical protein
MSASKRPSGNEGSEQILWIFLAFLGLAAAGRAWQTYASVIVAPLADTGAHLRKFLPLGVLAVVLLAGILIWRRQSRRRRAYVVTQLVEAVGPMMPSRFGSGQIRVWWRGARPGRIKIELLAGSRADLPAWRLQLVTTVSSLIGPVAASWPTPGILRSRRWLVLTFEPGGQQSTEPHSDQSTR